MKYSKRKDKALSTEEISVYKVVVTGFPNVIEDVNLVLEFLDGMRRDLFSDDANINWIIHPMRHNSFNAENIYLESSNKLNQIFSDATLLQQIEYLSFIGITDSIDRNPAFREAVNFHRFSRELYLKAGIVNAEFPRHSDLGVSRHSIRKIHAVHASYLEDEEIKCGLHVSYSKRTEDSQVLYVCSEATLDLALTFCQPNSILIVDGHWEHNKKATHGVWDPSSASEIARRLSRLLRMHPGKIVDIHLWGCEAGYIANYDELSASFDLNFLQFKDECIPDSLSLEMAEFRNRARYYSGRGEFPFARDSLAGEVITALQDNSITVTAGNGFTYPYPATARPIYNIASDSHLWHGPHFWKKIENNNLPRKFNKLHQVKSVTCLNRQASISNFTMTMWNKKPQAIDAVMESSTELDDVSLVKYELSHALSVIL